MADLFRCPFCGSSNIDEGFALGEINGVNFYQAGCWHCDATGPRARSEKEAAELWNKRADPAHAEGE